MNWFKNLIWMLAITQIICQTLFKNSKKAVIFVMFSMFGAMMMFKANFIGNDTHTYITLFDSITHASNLAAFMKKSRFETGFIYLVRALNKISDDPQILFIFSGAVVAISFGRFIYKYSKISWLSILMYFTLQFFDLSMSGIRQILAISVLLFAYDFLVEKRFIPFLILVLLASSVHSSAICFLILYPLANFRMSDMFLAASAAIGGVAFLAFDKLFGILGRVFPNYLKYFTNDGTSYSTSAKLATVFMLLLWLVLFLVGFLYTKKRYRSIEVSAVLAEDGKEDIKEELPYTPEMLRENIMPKRIFVRKKKKKKEKLYAMLKEERIDNINQIAVWLGCIFLFLSLKGTILTRFKFIFSAPILVYYPNILTNIKNEKERDLVYFISCVVFVTYSWVIYTYRPEWQSTYPYFFFWQVP